MKPWQKEILEKTKDEPVAPIFLCTPALRAELQKRVEDSGVLYESSRRGLVDWTIDELTKMKIL
jgi:hypothetical protein